SFSRDWSSDVCSSDLEVPASVEVVPDRIEFDALGDSAQVAAVVRNADGAEIGDAVVTWASLDEGVATVDGEGWVVARGNGSTRALGRASCRGRAESAG